MAGSVVIDKIEAHCISEQEENLAASEKGLPSPHKAKNSTCEQHLASLPDQERLKLLEYSCNSQLYREKHLALKANNGLVNCERYFPEVKKLEPEVWNAASKKAGTSPSNEALSNAISAARSEREKAQDWARPEANELIFKTPSGEIFNAAGPSAQKPTEMDIYHYKQRVGRPTGRTGEESLKDAIAQERNGAVRFAARELGLTPSPEPSAIAQTVLPNALPQKELPNAILKARGLPPITTPGPLSLREESRVLGLHTDASTPELLDRRAKLYQNEVDLRVAENQKQVAHIYGK